MTPTSIRNEKLAPSIIDALKKNGFTAYYARNKEQALTKALELIPTTDVVAWGGSFSISEIGLLDAIIQRNPVINRDLAKDNAEKIELMRQSLLCDTYLASTNALTMDGHLLNIDGTGNRVSAMTFGPKQVILIVGMNKVVKTLDDAINHVRSISAPINAQRFDITTPCHVKGACSNCSSPTSICNYFVTTRMCKPAGRIKIILVNENLGI